MPYANFPCPDCGAKVWDNRQNKKNPKMPDYKCSMAPQGPGQQGCQWVKWPPKGQPAAVPGGKEPNEWIVWQVAFKEACAYSRCFPDLLKKGYPEHASQVWTLASVYYGKLMQKPLLSGRMEPKPAGPDFRPPEERTNPATEDPYQHGPDMPHEYEAPPEAYR